MTVIPDISTDVLIIGAGPAGLTAAATLAPHLPGGVTVVEREAAAGGIPRHSDHPGYGIRDLKRFLSGPAYARRLTTAATNAGAAIHTQTMVTGWNGERAVEITSPAGPTPDPGPSDHPRHRCTRTPPPRPADPRRPAHRRLHHRPAAKPRPPAPPTGRHPCSHRRRRARQLVSGHDPPRSPLRHRPDDHRAPHARGLRRNSRSPVVSHSRSRCIPGHG